MRTPSVVVCFNISFASCSLFSDVASAQSLNAGRFFFIWMFSNQTSRASARRRTFIITDISWGVMSSILAEISTHSSAKKLSLLFPHNERIIFEIDRRTPPKFYLYLYYTIYVNNTVHKYNCEVNYIPINILFWREST